MQVGDTVQRAMGSGGGGREAKTRRCDTVWLMPGSEMGLEQGACGRWETDLSLLSG